MNIIKHGRKPITLRFECKECGCVFEVEDRECGITIYFEGFYAFCYECPDCGKQVVKYYIGGRNYGCTTV